MATMKVKATLDSRNYERNVDKMRQKNSKFNGGLGKVKGMMKKAFAVAAIIAVVRAIARATMALVNFGSELSDMAAQTGISVESFQKLQRAVRDAGGESQHLVNALTRVKDAQGEVVSGDKMMIEAFDRLGISIGDVASMNTEELFLEISKSLTASGNSADRFSAVADVIGQRNVPKLLEAMNQLANDGFGAMSDGLVTMSNDSAQTLDIVADRWERWKNNVKTASASVVADLFGLNDSIQREINKREAQAERIAEIERKTREEAARTLRLKEQTARKEKIAKEEDKRAKQIKKIEESVKIQIETDSLRKIGGFAGSQVSDSLRMSRKQVETLEKIKDYQATLPRIEENTRERGLA